MTLLSVLKLTDYYGKTYIEIISTVQEQKQNYTYCRFESREYSFGHYVVSISNIAETESGNRWMVYVIPADINHAKPDKKFLLKTGNKNKKCI